MQDVLTVDELALEQEALLGMQGGSRSLKDVMPRYKSHGLSVFMQGGALLLFITAAICNLLIYETKRVSLTATSRTKSFGLPVYMFIKGKYTLSIPPLLVAIQGPLHAVQE
eukprot:1142442-Pelagomonas_calceolata.AAC.2